MCYSEMFRRVFLHVYVCVHYVRDRDLERMRKEWERKKVRCQGGCKR